MKKLYPVSTTTIFKRCIILLITTVAIIYGCKKEMHGSKDASTITDQTVAEAKTWFENIYPAANNGQPVHTNSTDTGVDLSQSVKPDWQHTAIYARLDKDVIEMPIDPDSKLGFILKKKVNNNTYNKTYTRSSFLLLKDAKGYEAYIMTIVADSSYIKNDPAKLANNTYRQHDADFSGLVLYFTPKGKYVNGYAYKDGVVVSPSSQEQSSGNIRVQLAQACTDWYADIYENNILISSVYLYTTCTGGGDNDGGGGVPQPCTTTNPNTNTNVSSVKNGKTTNAIKVMLVNPNDGGFLPPGTNPTPPCVIIPTPSTDIKNKVKDPCLKKMVDATINANVNTQVNSLIQSVFGGSTTINLTFIDVNNLSDIDDGYTPFNGNIVNGIMNAEVQLNANTLPNFSREYIAAAIMHEALHTYLDAKNMLSQYQHEAMMVTYASQMASSLHQMFPTLSIEDAQSLAIDGLQSTPTFKATIATDLGLLQNYEATNLAYSKGSKGTRCK